MEAPNERIRLFFRYKTLFVADFRAFMFDVERAYNQLTAAEHGTSRIRLAQRLQFTEATTEKSLEIVLLGTFVGVLAFAEVVRRLSQARNEFWKSEKTKWEARSVKREFEERERKNRPVSPAERCEYAGAILVDRFGRVLRKKNIVLVEVDALDTGIVITDEIQPRRLTPGREE